MNNSITAYIEPRNNKVKQMYEKFMEQNNRRKYKDSGFDLLCVEDITIPANAIGFKLKLGVKIVMIHHRKVRNEIGWGVNHTPKAYYLYARSSMGSRSPLRLSNHVGIFDGGYRGESIAIIDNISNKDFDITAGTRLVQICLPSLEYFDSKIVDYKLEKKYPSNRGTNGLGSTN